MLDNPGWASPVDVLGAKDLVSAYSAAKEAFDSSAPYRKHRKDPITMAIYAAHLVGWEFCSAVEIRDDLGQVMSIVDASPGMLKVKFREAWGRCRVKKGIQHLRKHHAVDFGDAAEYDLHLAKRMFGSRAMKALTWKEKISLMKFVCGAMPTRAQLADLGLLEANDVTCKACGQGHDDVFHRLWECKAYWNDERLPQAMRKPALAKGRGSEYSVGWVPRPTPTREVDDGKLWYEIDGVEVPLVEGMVFFDGDSPVYLDGSCVYPSSKALARAGFAAGQFRDGRWHLLLGLAPSHMPQTAAVGEHLAVLHATARGAEPLFLVTDCASVKSCYETKKWAKGWLSYADLWRQVPEVYTIVKVKAHQARASIPQWDLEALRDHAGNEVVDLGAKMAASRGLPSEITIRQEVQHVASTLALYRHAAVVLASHCPIDSLAYDMLRSRDSDQRKGLPRPSNIRGPRHMLVWVESCGMFVCEVCGSRFRSRSRGHANRCHGIQTSFVDACRSAVDMGHRIEICKLSGMSSFSFAYCRQCFHYSTCRMSKLKQPCKGALSKQIRRAKDIREGIHPTYRLGLRGHTRFCAACFGDRSSHVCGMVLSDSHSHRDRDRECALQEVCEALPVDAPSWGFDRGEAEPWEMEEHDDEEGPMETW